MKKHYTRPINTAYLGENGDKLPIYIGSNYDVGTGKFTPQYIPRVLYGQYLYEIINSSSFYQIQSEKPDDLIKLAALYYIFNNKKQFQVFNNFDNNKIFTSFEQHKVLPNLPYQQPNVISTILGKAPSYYHTKQELDNLNKNKSLIDWIKDNWPF